MNNILIVDDDNSVRAGIMITLEDKYKVASAPSAADAFNHLAKHKVDLVLMDIRMPKMNGLDALQEMKERHPETAVVMMTAYATEENVKRAMESGAKGFIRKPFDLEELRSFVDSTLAEKKK